jgi:endonuclease I
MVETVTDTQLRDNINKFVKHSGLDVEDLVTSPTSGAKQELMRKWSQDYPLTTLELQRVLRIVEEIGGRK